MAGLNCGWIWYVISDGSLSLRYLRYHHGDPRNMKSQEVVEVDGGTREGLGSETERPSERKRDVDGPV